MPTQPWGDDDWYRAVSSNDVPVVLAMLQDGWPVDRPVQETFPAGRSALNLALRHEDLAMAYALLDADANVHHRDAMRLTPLMDACFWPASTAMVERLIVAGADVNAVSYGGLTPLHWASRQGYAEKVDRLLWAGAFPFAQTPSGETALDMALSGNERHAAVVDRLHRDEVRALETIANNQNIAAALTRRRL